MKTIETAVFIITTLIVSILICICIIMANEEAPLALRKYSDSNCTNHITVEVGNYVRMYEASAIYRSIFGEYIIKEGDVIYTVKAETALIKVDCGGRTVNGAVPQENLTEEK